MANYIKIFLDTSPPLIEIYAPSYTAKGIANRIELISNEPLDEFQEIYSIDAEGTKQLHSFQRQNETSFVGTIIFYTDGLATLYVRLQDSVGNYTDTLSKEIMVREVTNTLLLSISDSAMTTLVDTTVQKITTDTGSQTMEISLVKKGD